MVRRNITFEKLIEVIEEYISRDEFPSKDKKGHSVTIHTRVPEFIETVLEVFRQEFDYVYLTRSDVVRHALYLGILELYRRWYRIENKETSLYKKVLKVIGEKMTESTIQKQLSEVITERLELVKKNSQEMYQEVIVKIKEILEKEGSSKIREDLEEIINRMLIRDAIDMIQNIEEEEEGGGVKYDKVEERRVNKED